MTLLHLFLKIFPFDYPESFWNATFLASVWMRIHSSRMGAYYTLSEAVTAAFSEEAKHFTAQTMHPGRHTSTYTHARVCTRGSNYTQTHWHNAHGRDERANLSNHQPRQARGRIVPALVWRKRARCSCLHVCNFDFSFSFFFLLWQYSRSAQLVPNAFDFPNWNASPCNADVSWPRGYT